MKRKIPYGVINWERLVNECYVVDNTAYIRELENCATPVFLRPKRFGKSIVCSMLEYYYDVNRKDRFQELFGRFDIGKDPTPLANSFLVLTFDFSTITVGTVKEIEERFFKKVKGCVKSFTVCYSHLADWSGIWDAETPSGLIDGVRQVIRDNGLPPLYVIVDEYDNFTNELVVSRRDGDYDAICGHDSEQSRESFFKAFFKSFKAGLKDNTVGRTYFTGVLPITLDDLSSGYNVGTVISLDEDKLGMVGFTEAQVRKYVDEVFADYEFDPSLKPTVLSDLKAFYDGYHFLPGAEPLYNSTITNWYLRCLVVNKGKIPENAIDSNVRTDVAWIRLLAGGSTEALASVRKYVERGEGESAERSGLAAKFGRVKFFSEDFFPYALYYLGILTFESPFRLGIPNLTIRNMLVDYYDELGKFKNGLEARNCFVGAAESLAMDGGTWQALFDAYWQHYVKARIPAQAFDKINENFFRTTFASRVWDVLPRYYSIETEFNTPEGRCDFLAIPKPGFAKPACLIEFKYFKASEVKKGKLLGRKTPDEETVAQAKRYRESLPRRPGWRSEIVTYVVEVCSRRGYNWFEIA